MEQGAEIQPVATATCALCQREISLAEYHAHLQLHERAEMLADIMALSRH